MLIVSIELFYQRGLSHGAVSYEFDGLRRDARSHRLVEDEEDIRRLMVVIEITAAGIGVHFDGDMAGILREWCHCLPSEKAAWEERGSLNAPIFAQTTWEARREMGKLAEVRVYDNAVDIVLALVGALEARENRILETELADRVLTNVKIRNLVRIACQQTVAYLDRYLGTDLPMTRTTHAKVVTLNLLHGEYYTLHRQSWMSWETDYVGQTTSVNIMALHDIYTWLDDVKNWVDPWNATLPFGEDDKRLFTNKRTMRHNVGTVNEDSLWTIRARWGHLPTWAGPSGTIHGLCWMLKRLVGVSDEVLLACAYALFAVWASPIYPKTSTPIHHLFGVMSGVAEYIDDRFAPAYEAETLYLFLRDFLDT